MYRPPPRWEISSRSWRVATTKAFLASKTPFLSIKGNGSGWPMRMDSTLTGTRCIEVAELCNALTRGLAGDPAKRRAASIFVMESIDQSPAFLQKIVPSDALATALAHLPRPWVFTNGVFDVLQIGR